MSSKKTILVLCGGQSPEHEISILSAKNVVQQLRAENYDVFVGYIFKDGRWCYFGASDQFLTKSIAQLEKAGDWLQLQPGSSQPFQLQNSVSPLPIFDCIFPVMHGSNGEDGVVQGLLDMLGVPYVGSDVLGCAIAMHKDVTKELLQLAGIPVVPWIRVTKSSPSMPSYASVVEALGSPIFVKANSLGSSVGVVKVSSETQFVKALDEVFQYDDVLLIEQAISGREIECSVLGNEKPVASLPGEIINHTEFYSYSAKYLEADAATVQTPADLSDDVISQIRQMAIDVFKTVRCQGMARVDFFLTSNEKIFVNEINAIPGFTDISMYTKNWDVSGLAQSALFDKLIQLAITRFEKKKNLQRSVDQYRVECQHD